CTDRLGDLQLDYYTIGGTVTGLEGSGLTLQNNGKDTLVVTGKQFTFKTRQQNNTVYEITVSQQPTSPIQTCTVKQTGKGRVPGATISNIGIDCVNHYSIAGTVTGLQGNASLILQNNGIDDLPVGKNGEFIFDIPIADATIYNVSVLSLKQATDLAIAKTQSCTINGDSNNKPVEGINVTSVNIVCSTNQYSVGGTVSGLVGSGFSLTNVGLELAVSGTTFIFPAQTDGSRYLVTIANNPVGQSCEIKTAGSGTLSGAIVSNIEIQCDPLPMNFAANVDLKELIFTWDPLPSIDYYRILENPNGISGFTQLVNSGDISGSRYRQPIALHLFDAMNARYRLEAYEIQGSTPVLVNSSADLSVTDLLNDAIGYFKVPRPRPSERFGTNISISEDGRTIIVGAPGADYSSGLVYVFSKDKNGWSQLTGFMMPNARSDYLYTGTHNFGGSVSLSADGNTIAVGASRDNSASKGINGKQRYDCKTYPAPPNANCAVSSGAVFVYSRDVVTGMWDPTPVYIKANTTFQGYQFGASVSLNADGNVLAIGASTARTVHIYSRNLSTRIWNPNPANIKASSPSYVNSVSLSADGNTLAVGSMYESSADSGMANNPQPNDCSDAAGNANPSPINCARSSGVVYVYSRMSKKTAWGDAVYFKAPTINTIEQFGASISLNSDGNILAVGAPYAPISNYSGSVYVYTRKNKIWGSIPVSLTAFNKDDRDRFGSSLSLSADGNTLAVGALGESSAAIGVASPYNNAFENSAYESGAVYVFTRMTNSAAWNKKAKYIKAPNTAAGDGFGGNDRFGNLTTSISLSANGDTLAIGAPGEDSAAGRINGEQKNDCEKTTPTNCARDAGAVYLY
ncbi:MAG: hypothetical protein ACC707_11585, partial [Thiohalomonadales bacterium]